MQLAGRSLLLLAVAVVSLAFVSLPTTQAAVFSETASAADGFLFLNKFCYQYRSQDPVHLPCGDITLDIRVPRSSYPNDTKTPPPIRLCLYDDEARVVHGSWTNVLDNWDDWGCEDKVAAAKGSSAGVPASMNCSPLCHPRDDGTDCVPEWGGEGTPYWTTSFTSAPIRQGVRPRFWYFVLADCTNKLHDVHYRMHAVQAAMSSWNEEFGSNELGLNTTYLTFFFVYVLFLTIHGISTWKLQRKLSYLHPMLKLFLIVLVVNFIAVFVLLLHYGSYARNGIGMPSLLKAGEILVIVSRCFFMLLLLLLARGWTISHERLTKKWLVVTLVVSYLVVSIIILGYDYSARDPKLTKEPRTVEILTVLLNVVWLAFASWFTYAIFFDSYRHEENPHKKSMYLKLGVLFSPWFILPAVVSFLVFAMDPWARDRAIAIFNLCISTGAYIVLIFLFWHSRAEEYFSITVPDVMSGAGITGDEDYRTML